MVANVAPSLFLDTASPSAELLLARLYQVSPATFPTVHLPLQPFTYLSNRSLTSPAVVDIVVKLLRYCPILLKLQHRNVKCTVYIPAALVTPIAIPYHPGSLLLL